MCVCVCVCVCVLAHKVIFNDKYIYNVFIPVFLLNLNVHCTSIVTARNMLSLYDDRNKIKNTIVSEFSIKP